MFFGAFYADASGAIGENEDKYLIAALAAGGTLILDDSGHYRLFISGYPRITTLYDAFLLVYSPDGVLPSAQVYDLEGRLIAEGLPLMAREAARKKLRGQ